MSKKARLTMNEVTTLAQAEIVCRIGTGNSTAGGTAEEILKKYNELISQKKSKARPISKSSIEHKLADWRRDGKIPPAMVNLPTEERPLDSEIPWSLDQPWSLGCLAEREIFLEALPVVMQVWKQKQTWFEPLTIRQAQWVARLYRLIPADVVLITHWAELYALWERMGNLLGQKFESSAFDAALVMRPWELITAILTDTIKPDEGFGMLPIDELLRLSNETYVDTREEIDRVYLLWQYYFRKGPRWDNLNEKTQHEIEMQLRKWVLDCPWIEDERWLSSFMDGDISLTDLTASPFFKPSELLKEVGYEV